MVMALAKGLWWRTGLRVQCERQVTVDRLLVGSAGKSGSTINPDQQLANDRRPDAMLAWTQATDRLKVENFSTSLKLSAPAAQT
jgi:hypothetical protein